MRRLSRTGFRIALILAFVMATTALFSGAANAAVVPNCLGNGNQVLSAAYVVSNWNERLGSIQLCRDNGAREIFGLLIMYQAMPAGKWGNAVIDIRTRSGEIIYTFTCDDGSGNGHIAPGQTWCKTTDVLACSDPNALCGETARHWVRARGHVYEKDHYGNWEATARGVTSWIER
jgi:hypothetical protein